MKTDLSHETFLFTCVEHKRKIAPGWGRIVVHTLVSPDAKPYYALVYVTEDGLQNIWDIWMGAHSEKKE